MNSTIERLYGLTPIWFQNILISAYGRHLERARYTDEYRRHLEHLSTRRLDAGEVAELQNRLFLEFLDFAVKNSKFYRRFYKDVDLTRIKSVEDISQLPLLDKETLRQNIEDVYTIPRNRGIAANTGGTTGKSLTVLFTPEDTQRRMAYLAWFKRLHGVEMNRERNAHFNGKNIIPVGQKSKVFWRDNRGIDQRIYSSFFTSQQNIEYYVRNLNEYKPSSLSGFVSTMYDIAKYMDDRGLRAEFTPKAIFPTSETVLPMHRELLERVFGCPVRDQYASSEGAPFIIECPDGHMHECPDTGVFEHIPCGQGTKLVVTSFHTHGTPLIRYDIGDNILEARESRVSGCALSAFPVIEAIDGRKADGLYSPERGNISIANLSNVLKYLPNSVKNVQFIQTSERHIDVKIVTDPTRFRAEQKREIMREMVNRFGEKMTFDIVEVDEIPRAKSGKYQMIINKLDRKQNRYEETEHPRERY